MNGFHFDQLLYMREIAVGLAAAVVQYELIYTYILRDAP